MLDKTGKFLSGANTLAYLASPLATKKKSFITLTPGYLHQHQKSLNVLEDIQVLGSHVMFGPESRAGHVIVEYDGGCEHK